MRSSLALIIILALAAFGFGFFLTYPSYQSFETAKRNLKGAELKFNDASEKKAALAKLEAAQPTLGQKATQARDLIPTEEKREIFVNEVDAIAQANGVSLLTFNFSKVEPKKNTDEETTTVKTKKKPTKNNLGELGFTISVNGGYSNVKAFLTSLHALQRLAVIKNLNMASADTGVSGTINGIIYTKTEPKISQKITISNDLWDYLNERTTASVPPPSSSAVGRADPFSTY